MVEEILQGVDKGSLTVVGIGLKAGGQSTAEAVSAIKAAEKVYFGVADPVSQTWIRDLNPSAESITRFYSKGKDRRETYREIVDCLLSAVRLGRRVCAVFYGHPGVFVSPSHEAIRRARQEGFEARMLPGVSAEDNIFAELGFDPGEMGCQSFEATDFLIRRRRSDPRSYLLLWQIGALGERSIGAVCSPDRIRVLVDYLAPQYPADHEVILYEASPYVICESTILRMPLSALADAEVTPGMTLCIPPSEVAELDHEMMRRLRIEAGPEATQ